MKSDVRKILIEVMLEQIWKEAKSSPRRAVRNLIDLGIQFSNGRFQKNFLEYAGEMLKNEESAYYELAIDLLTNVEKEILLTFGMNIGYNGCTKGAKQIRELKKENKINIPWALNLILDQERLEKTWDNYSNLIDQGVELGIYVYLLYLHGGHTENVLPLLKKHRDCAFILFLRENNLNEAFVEEIKKCKNTMVSIYSDETAKDKCRILREHKVLYGVHKQYQETEAEEVLEEGWAQEITENKPYFVFVWVSHMYDKETQKKVYRKIYNLRMEQRQAFFFTDIKQDLRKINEIISGEGRAVGFQKDGSVYVYGEEEEQKPLNIFENSLYDILAKL